MTDFSTRCPLSLLYKDFILFERQSYGEEQRCSIHGFTAQMAKTARVYTISNWEQGLESISAALPLSWIRSGAAWTQTGTYLGSRFNWRSSMVCHCAVKVET